MVGANTCFPHGARWRARCASATPDPGCTWRLGKDAISVASADALPRSAPPTHVAILDARGAGFIVVPEGPLATTARRVLSRATR